MYTPSVLRLLASSLVAAMAVQASGISAALSAGALVLAAAPVLAVPAVNQAEPRGDIVPESGPNGVGSHCCG